MGNQRGTGENRLAGKGTGPRFRDTAGHYELWNSRTKNLYGTYESRGTALRATHAIVEAHGSEYAKRFILATEDDEGNTDQVATGTELIRLARLEGREGPNDEAKPPARFEVA